MNDGPNSQQEKIDISIILPVFNEEKNVTIISQSITSVLKTLTSTYEIIFIDDGSTDKSYTELQNLAKEQEEIKLVRFRRNFGQTAAMSAGIEFSIGDIIIFMDADLQNDPTDIPVLLEKMEEGFDVVSGWRKNRKDSSIKTIPSKIANSIIRKTSGVNIHDLGCTLKAYKSDIIREINLYGEMHRFIPILAYNLGANIAEVPVKHHPRKHGKSKYGLNRTFKVILDLLTIQFMGSFATKPIYVYGGFALACLFLGSISGTILILMKIIWETDMTGNPFLLLTVLFLLISIILFLMGIQAEVLTRIYHQSGKTKHYHIKETQNL